MFAKTKDTKQKEEERYQERTRRSRKLNKQACKYLPGGDSRSTLFYPPYPIFLSRGKGCRLYDVDGNEFLDFTGNHTSLILGYDNSAVTHAVKKQLSLGTCFPGPTEPQIRLAQILQRRTPSMERVRFTNSGTEATLNAIRAARAFTKRYKIAKVEGGYHGIHDSVEVSTRPDLKRAGDPLQPRSLPSVEGLSRKTAEDVIVFPFNDSQASLRILEKNRNELAAVIVEPVLGSAGMIPSERDFLNMLRKATRRMGALLIFDEVISFRIARGGAQEYYGIYPDLTCLGKFVGGGFPLGVFGGRKDVMALFDPIQGVPPIAHPGSYNANPVSLIAGATTLEQLTPAAYDRLNSLGEALRIKLRALFDRLKVPAQVTGIGSLFAIHFTEGSVRNYRDAFRSNRGLSHQVFLGIINEGVLMDPRGAGCLSTPMTESEIDLFVDALHRVMRCVRP